MTQTSTRARARLSLLAGSAVVLLAACNEPLDFDLRGISGGFSTADAAQTAVTDRPNPDERGVISYPSYQVAVADRGDTINTVASRLGFAPEELSRYNGVDPNVPLRRGEVIALPRRVSDQPSVTAAQPGAVDISTLAGDAINRAPEPSSEGVRVASLPPQEPNVVKAQEPIRHKVERGETAYIIARLYNVPVKSLAEWNGLGPDFAIREGQRLLIPVAKQAPPSNTQTAAVAAPGAGSATPTPPSAAQPLPEEDTKPIVEPTEPVASLSTTAASAPAAAMVFPVSGTIIREYSKGKNDGINIKAAPGSPVKAAEAGSVAAITQSGEGIPIVVVRHDANLLTVYANVADVSVKKGDSVKRGQTLAKLRDGDDAYVHFEVRKGFDSVDPMPYLQ